MLKLIPTRTMPAWQIERAMTLHRICRCVKSRLSRGQSRFKAVAFLSRRWNGRTLKRHPSRHYAVNVSTLYRHYKTWLLRGESPLAFQLNFGSGNRRIAAPLMVRFINFTGAQEFKSLRHAWRAFCERGGSYGPGRKTAKFKLKYDALRWNLPRGFFAGIKRCHKTIRETRSRLDQLCDHSIAEVRRRAPEQIARRKPSNYEI